MEDAKIKVELDVIVTQQDIDDIVTTALEGGINYWCRKAEVVGDYLGEYASDQISRGGTLRLYDREVDADYGLDRDRLLIGIRKYLEDPEKPYDILESSSDSVGCSKGESTLDTCMVDGAVADMIVQYALFGEIVYG